MRRAWRPPSKSVVNQTRTTASAVSCGITRSPNDRTLASLCCRESFATSSFQQSAQRTPRTVLAYIAPPLPQPPTPIPTTPLRPPPFPPGPPVPVLSHSHLYAGTSCSNPDRCCGKISACRCRFGTWRGSMIHGERLFKNRRQRFEMRARIEHEFEHRNHRSRHGRRVRGQCADGSRLRLDPL